MGRETVIKAINDATKGINQYLEIMLLFQQTDVSKNKEFQKKFNGFYRVRQRNEQFYKKLITNIWRI